MLVVRVSLRQSLQKLERCKEHCKLLDRLLGACKWRNTQFASS